MEQIKLSKKQKYSYKMQKYLHFYSPELWASNSWTEKEKPISKILPDVNPFEMNICKFLKAMKKVSTLFLCIHDTCLCVKAIKQINANETK